VRHGDLPALVYNNKRWTYAELLARVNRMAGGLSRMGVRKGERVLLTYQKLATTGARAADHPLARLNDWPRSFTGTIQRAPRVGWPGSKWTTSCNANKVALTASSRVMTGRPRRDRATSTS